MSQQDNIAQLAAELNGHSVTDEQGNVTESETVEQEAAPVESTTVEESTHQAEKPAEPVKPAPQAEETEEEIPVEDETGKRYVPEKRFKEVYAKAKESERKLKEMQSQIQQGQQLLQTPKGKKVADDQIPVDKADLLEVKLAFPQFDPKKTDVYDPDLDEDAGIIWKAAKGSLTPLQAAEKALEKRQRLEKRIATQVSGAKQEARLVKTSQSDQGITTKVISRAGTQPNFDQMSDKDMETWLKQNNQW